MTETRGRPGSKESTPPVMVVKAQEEAPTARGEFELVAWSPAPSACGRCRLLRSSDPAYGVLSAVSLGPNLERRNPREKLGQVGIPRIELLFHFGDSHVLLSQLLIEALDGR